MFKWVIVVNEHYGNKRGLDELFKGFADIPEVNSDCINVKNGLMALGAREADIITVRDTDKLKMSHLFADLREDVSRNMVHDMKTFIFLYYAGHGGMVNNYTVMVLNEKLNYPLET